jgi:hypothetical protein
MTAAAASCERGIDVLQNRYNLLLALLVLHLTGLALEWSR